MIENVSKLGESRAKNVQVGYSFTAKSAKLRTLRALKFMDGYTYPASSATRVTLRVKNPTNTIYLTVEKKTFSQGCIAVEAIFYLGLQGCLFFAPMEAIERISSRGWSETENLLQHPHRVAAASPATQPVLKAIWRLYPPVSASTSSNSPAM